MKTETLYLTREEAARTIRRAPKGAQFRLSVSARLYRATLPMGRRVQENRDDVAALPLSRKQATQLCADMLPAADEQNGFRIRVMIHESEEHESPAFWTFWITQ